MKGRIHVRSLCAKCLAMLKGKTIFDGADFCPQCLSMVHDAGALTPSGHLMVHEETVLPADAITEDGSVRVAACDAPDASTAAPEFKSPEVNVSYTSPGPVVVEISGLSNMIEAVHRDVRRLTELYDCRLEDVASDLNEVNLAIRGLTDQVDSLVGVAGSSLNVENDQLRADRDRAFAHLRKFPPPFERENIDSWREGIMIWWAGVAAILDPPEITPEITPDDQEEYIIRDGRVMRNPNFKGE